MTTASTISPLGIHSEVFACPVCKGKLEETIAGITCDRCETSYLTSEGHADFASATPVPAKVAFAPLRLQDPLVASRYESCSRPSFFRIMGGNWEDQLTYAAEATYLSERMKAQGGPVLDLACGAGSWTKAIADAVGVDEVIALDISPPMLARCRTAIPGIVAVRGSALSLPIRTGSLSAVSCWNSLQQLPSPPQVIAEIGRCLRPGGAFTLLTYRTASTPLARYFQHRHEAGFDVTAFREDDIRRWLADASLEVLDIAGPGSFLVLTAQRVKDGQKSIAA
jgi:SAM-dependent methyltransferase